MVTRDKTLRIAMLLAVGILLGSVWEMGCWPAKGKSDQPAGPLVKVDAPVSAPVSAPVAPGAVAPGAVKVEGTIQEGAVKGEATGIKMENPKADVRVETGPRTDAGQGGNATTVIVGGGDKTWLLLSLAANAVLGLLLFGSGSALRIVTDAVHRAHEEGGDVRRVAQICKGKTRTFRPIRGTLARAALAVALKTGRTCVKGTT